MQNDSGRAVLAAAREAVRTADAPLLLAVSGGLDSMALLSAMSAVARERIAAVATFDHGTGDHATRAVSHVRRAGARLGLRVVSGRMEQGGRHTEGREAAWREARHRFLRDSATSLGARVVTAHTEDDQLETVVMRIMRGSGARGLAGLYADGEVMRPFAGLRRAALESYASEAGVRCVEDPSNVSRAFFRNRVRHDLLPAMRQVCSDVDESLLGLSRRAALLRADVEAFVTAQVEPSMDGGDRLVVASAKLADYDRDSLAVLWAALAGRAGLALDRRGTRRIAEFTSSHPHVGRIPLAGGWCLEARRATYILQRSPAAPDEAVALPLRGSLEWGGFRFSVSRRIERASPWTAAFAGETAGLVRAWSAGDRLEPADGKPRRRVTRYLSDAGLQGGERAGWPVVVAGEDVVWIPGVRRSDAATDRSGRPVRHYVCERIDR
jgi:tRNA(Ile)-lysidine synthase